MVTLLGSLLGFISAAFPDFLKLIRDHQDRKHELTILQLQMQQQAQGHSNRLEEIHVEADIAESRALYKTYNTGIRWVDTLNGTVRPVIAYSFFVLYALVKLMQFFSGLPWMLWTPEDQAIFAGIISFYFGQRAMSKLRQGK
ncbi:holin family protein [Rickettsiales bacterium]|nr:holin family protein [Rickettsiales bacterium]